VDLPTRRWSKSVQLAGVSGEYDGITLMEDDFTTRLAHIDCVQLESFLRALRAPCYESELFRVAFPALDIATADPLALYQSHFLLFHVLYRLQERLYAEGQYLHIHFMRTSLMPYPPAGQCRYFEEYTGHFCQTACAPEQGYCPFHVTQMGDAAIKELSLRYFYLAPENFYKLDAHTATAFLNGTWEILAHYDAYKKSFAVLGLPETADLKLIKKRFKQLAKLYHPDRGAQANEQFHAINNAYQLLLHIHGVMQAGLTVNHHAE
jgi:hypothetical protein